MRGMKGGECEQNVVLQLVALLNKVEQHKALNLLVLHGGAVVFHL